MANQKPKRNFKKEVEQDRISVGAAIKELEKEIIEEVKKVSSGAKSSIYDLVEKGKELLILEKMSGEGSPSRKDKPQAPAKSKGGIKPVAENDDFEDEESDVAEGDF